MNSEYAFVSRWPVALSRERLWDVVEHLLASDNPLVWWPSVHVSHYDGSAMRVRVRSALGYAVTFTLAELEASRPDALRFTASGDLQGSGDVSFVPDGPVACVVVIDWRVTTRRRWMRRTAWVLRPAFVAGHHLVMRQGRRHLTVWLAETASRPPP